MMDIQSEVFDMKITMGTNVLAANVCRFEKASDSKGDFMKDEGKKKNRHTSILLDAVSSGEPELRRKATKELMELADMSILPELIQMLHDQNPHVRKAAISVIGAVGEKEGIDAIVPLLRDRQTTDFSDVDWSKDAVCELAARALDTLGWENTGGESAAYYYIAKKEWSECERLGGIAVLPLLSVCAVSSSPEDSKAEMAQETLIRIGKAAVEPLILTLSSQSEDSREVASWVLGQIGDERAVEPLVEMLDDDASNTAADMFDSDEIFCTISETAAYALDRLGWQPDSIAVKVKYLIAKKDWHSITELGAQALPSISAALKRYDPRVTKRVADCLDEIGWNPGNDENRALYLIANGEWEQCVSIGLPAVKHLVALAKLGFNERAIWVLGEIGERKAAVELLQIFQDSTSSSIRAAVACSLGKIGDACAVESLLGAINNEHLDFGYVPGYGSEKIEAIRALGRIGDCRALVPLTQIRDNENGEVRAVAEAALVRIAKQQE